MIRRLALCSTTLLGTVAVCLGASAQPVSGPYVSLGAGASFAEDQPLHPVTPGFNPYKVDFQFNPGPAAVAGIGYGFGNGIRVEINGDYLNNHVSGARSPYVLRAGGYENQYGVFVNGYYDFNLGLPLTPYIGAGIGYQLVEEDSLNFSPPGFTFTDTHSQETHGGFSYQGIAGVSYPLTVLGVGGISLTAEYRFIGTSNPPGYAWEGNGRRFYGELHNINEQEALLGLRWAFGLPQASPATARETQSDLAPPVMPPVSAPRTYLVFFDWDRADLSPRAQQIVQAAATPAQQQGTTRIEVSGYTDLSGTAVYNQALSVRRAQSVKTELVKDGVTEDEIAIHGYGESNPLIPTAKGVREPQNRRVEIVLK